MTKPRVVGMLVDHREIDHLLTQMSDVLRNKAYQYANNRYPVGHKDRHQYFDDDGTLLGYDIDTNKALLRDSLDHYVQYSRDVNPTERLDFANYLQENFQMVANDILNDPHALSFLTASFSSACGILSSVLSPVMEDIANHGQLIDRIESFTTSFENTFYLVVGEDVDDPEQYDPTEDDLSTVDCDQTPEELAQLEKRSQANTVWNSAPRIKFNGIKDTSQDTYVNPMSGITKEKVGINLTWNPEV